MILGYHAIKSAFRDGGPWTAYRGSNKIPVDSLHINPNSVDVTLSNRFAFQKPEHNHMAIDPYDSESQIEYTKIEADQYLLNPGDVVLASVNERFECGTPFDNRRWVPMYEGRSTIARLFVATHVTAGFGDYGFSGAFTLEIVNHNPRPIWLYAGMRIGQVYWLYVESPCIYEGQYSVDHNDGPVTPKLGRMRF